MLAEDLSVSNGGRTSSATSSASDARGGQGEELVPDDMMLGEFKKRTLQSAQRESEESAAKKTRYGESSEPVSPSRSLYPPLFAGRVSQEEDVFHWDEHEDLTAVEGEDVEYEDLMEEEMEDAPKNEQGETPPELSPEALDAMDQETAVEELNRLSKIGVIEEFVESCANGEEKRWKRRKYKWKYAATPAQRDNGVSEEVEYSADGEITHTGVDEYERTDAMEDAKYSKFEVCMLVMVVKQHGSKATARVLHLLARSSGQRKKRVPWMMKNGSLPKKKLQEAEDALKYVLGARKEYVRGTRSDIRIARTTNVSESMRKASGERTTTEAQQLNKETAVGMKDRVVVCEEEVSKRTATQENPWSICHQDFVAKGTDVLESVEEQQSK
ncbi:unnamed protein product, partial [Symbiodinium necroappetens]